MRKQNGDCLSAWSANSLLLNLHVCVRNILVHMGRIVRGNHMLGTFSVNINSLVVREISPLFCAMQKSRIDTWFRDRDWNWAHEQFREFQKYSNRSEGAGRGRTAAVGFTATLVTRALTRVQFRRPLARCYAVGTREGGRSEGRPELDRIGREAS